MLCMFIVYILCAICIQRQKAYIFHTRNYIILLIIGITTMLAAYIYVFTPATLSEDIYLYADYGRILLTHHANPYFTPPLSFPQDPLFHFVWWKNIVAIYGPIWMLVCAALTSFTGTNAAHIFLAFRIFASTIHIINTILIFAILRTKGCSICTILPGTQLYTWNPLVLFESSKCSRRGIFHLLLACCRIKTHLSSAILATKPARQQKQVLHALSKLSDHQSTKRKILPGVRQSSCRLPKLWDGKPSSS